MTTTLEMNSPSLTCLPRFGTRRRPERATLGPAVGKVARLIGKPFMPWQQHVADVILEIDPVTGRLAYDEFGLTVPRQSGKSTFILAKSTHRASATKFFGPRQRLVYTAQTRQKAREKWEEDYAADLMAARAFAAKILVHKGNGNEHIRFPNGSRFGIEANTEKAGHGGTLDEGYIDEAFAQPDNRLEQAFGPAMITRINKQLGWISTAGWLDGSPYLEEKTKVGRRAVATDTGRGIAYFEWSAPDDADPGDHATWYGCMPALGYTVTIDAIQAEYDKAVLAGKLNDFKRAYLNMWVPKTVTENSLIPDFKWEECRDPDSQMVTAPTFGLEVAPDRGSAAIVAAGFRSDGKPQTEITSTDEGRIVDSRGGVEWVIPRLIDIDTRWDDLTVNIAAGSPAEALKPEIEELGIGVNIIPSAKIAAACGYFYDKATTGGIKHLGQESLTRSVLAARKHQEDGEVAWRFGRRRSGSSLTDLYAATLAVWALVDVDDDHGEVSVYSFDDLDACDGCGKKPHEDPDGDHDYLCEDCRDKEN